MCIYIYIYHISCDPVRTSKSSKPAQGPEVKLLSSNAPSIAWLGSKNILVPAQELPAQELPEQDIPETCQ